MRQNILSPSSNYFLPGITVLQQTFDQNETKQKIFYQSSAAGEDFTLRIYSETSKKNIFSIVL